ncbi:MAG: hypothetical protein IIW93_02885, partial [Bacteroidaceae bacterium]|nr:hypothetical protein [Bacteroidaceae bacterium]
SGDFHCFSHFSSSAEKNWLILRAFSINCCIFATSNSKKMDGNLQMVDKIVQASIIFKRFSIPT